MDDKIIVTHRGALIAKYGTKGVKRIDTALRALSAADRKRGIKTKVVNLDDARTMKSLRTRPLSDNTDCRAVKVAIDGVYKRTKPDYLMILGATDVIPHCDLRNPAFDAGDDDDRFAYGDLPYACDAPYSRDIATFVGPTRVLGRLPDLTGASEPSHLIALLKTATRWKRRKRDDYIKHFGLSTHSWRKSSQLSIDEIFGENNGTLLIAPPKGPRYRAELGARMHFINCHGGPAAPEFYGEKGSSQPVALTTDATARKIREGTVASVECCYGAELYDSVILDMDIPICQSYLRQGGYGYLGSTTIAYGPAEPPNGAADVLCACFLRNVLTGASVGRATLQARQQFVEQCDQADAMDLKTLAQFCLYGDPSITPVEIPAPMETPKGVSKELVNRADRHDRREKLRKKGEFLKQTKPTASKPMHGARMTRQVKTALGNFAVEGGLPRGQRFTAYAVKGARKSANGKTKAEADVTRYYVAVGRPRRGSPYRVVVVARERNGHVFERRIYYER